MSLFFLITLFVFTIIFVEIFYSLYKKDKKHTPRATFNNLVNGLVVYFFSKKILLFYVLYVFSLISYSPHELSRYPFISFITCLIVMDFMLYFLHRFKHTVSFLWEFHKYHHSDKLINTTTALRVSLFEQLYVYCFLIPLFLLGFSLETILLSFLTLSIYQIYVHNTYIKVPNFLEHILVSPRLHKIHHDERSQLQKSNYGSMFIFWDKLFGTSKDVDEILVIGVSDEHEDNFIKNQFKPLQRIYKKYV
jgi:sterol desaturase/sphingolipid hydroxylase (fatty acid hydroxylase superfamily)